MRYRSTSRSAPLTSLRGAVLRGLAPDGGLYMPVEIARRSPEELEQFRRLPFTEVCFRVAKPFATPDVPEEVLWQVVSEAISFPVKLVSLSPGLHILELFHGPTLAFKDFGARFMARLMGYFVRGEGRPLTVLVATSGDTGSAVAHGFLRVPGIRVVILYPSKRISEAQEKQFTTLGENITALEVAGTFDDCQRLVKQAFSDVELNKHAFLTSANSINIGRLLPQTFYHVAAYRQLPVASVPLIVSVPSGNFGNLTAGIFITLFEFWLHKVAYDYVTLFDVYECTISPDVLERKIQDAERRLEERYFLLVTPCDWMAHVSELKLFELVFDQVTGMYRSKDKPGLRSFLESNSIEFECLSEAGFDQIDPERQQQLQAVKRWFYNDWRRIEPKLRTSIVEGISVFLSLFDDNPAVKRTFCPPPECYDDKANADHRFGKPLPSFSWLIETGKVCALNFPIAMNPGLAKAIGVMMKLDFQRAVLNRIPAIEAHPERHFRQVFFLCDEYQHFATVGETEPTGDEKFFSLSRQPKCIPIIATQSISSLKSSLPGDTWRTLLQTFRTKIFLALSDDFSAKTASELCGREDQLKVSYNLSESGHDAHVSLLTGKSISHKANITASKSYYPHSDFRFDMKTFTELKNAQAIVIAYDGLNPMPPTFCYLKPYYNDPNKSYFQQLAEGVL